ncbi:hypothetical protein TCAL_02788 [Tigriopus californicus]|uniref:Codanin-1 C-terminal domain-containing protein n=1 Tax=Tigriopus californicus TaxID=6832 RepID=A0A553NXN5_TIGCA|nr:codanin-1-like [Tigriopus californicus]TRY70177.1 hypothetical protein TCAL_02788 [Tigriopus californicus]|eukprot:TCALIF_02788-PA protein Name:"Similar to CDAN1 Codanin-1 (Homo sapiens)" AED:0.02 eAED:0.02 QI:173/1/0.8/1/1/1/10/118/1413
MNISMEGSGVQVTSSEVSLTGNPILDLILHPEVDVERFITWYELQKTRNQRSASVNRVTQAFGESRSMDLKMLKPELALIVINFIRDQAERILTESQSCYDSPTKKAPLTASKYDYASPMKALRSAPNAAEREKVNKAGTSKVEVKSEGKKKRVQLFSAERDLDQDENLVDVKVLAEGPSQLKDEDRKVNLEERLNAASSSNTFELKILTQDKTRKPVTNRRSLDSMKDNVQHQWENNRKKMSKSQSAPKVNLSDFIVEKKPKKNRKNGQNRQSLSPNATLNSGESRTIPGLNLNQEKKRSKSPPKSRSSSEEDRHHSRKTTWPLEDKMATLQERFSPACPAQDSFEKAEVWSSIANGFDRSESCHENVVGPKVDEPVGKVPATPRKSSNPFGDEQDFAPADPDQVTHKADLDKLVQIYSYCLDRNMVPNPAVELYLMTELLVVREMNDPKSAVKDESQLKLLDSVSNCVYFAVKFFEHQSGLLELLEWDYLRFLAQNSRIEAFSSTLMEKVQTCFQTRAKNSQENRKMFSKDRVLETVRFQMETDNLQNFPSDRLFQDFKKQRDLFYEILREDEELSEDSNETATSTSLNERQNIGKKRTSTPTKSEKAIVKIQQLVNLQKHPVNLLHLAQLIHNQMMSTCVAEALECLFDEDDIIDKGLNPRKLRQLQSRFESHEGGQSSLVGGILKPKFPGSQEFYRKFIQNCNSFSFVQHLKNCLLQTIETHEATSFTLDDYQSSGPRVELTPNDFAQFSTSLLSLRISAKFLGFIESMPYQCSSESLSETILCSQLKYRLKLPQPLDLHHFLKESLRQKRLTLTLPWIIEYCCNLDPIAQESKYYQSFFTLLVNVYKVVLMPLNSDMFPMNRFMLNLTLGCFFENPFIPRELFFNFPSHSESVLQRILQGAPTRSIEKPLDQCVLISPKLLLICCPYLSELKKVASQFETGVKILNESHNMTMLNMRSDLRAQGKEFASSDGRRRANLIAISEFTGVLRDPAFISDNDLKKQKEHHFFYNQPPSLKKIVDFVHDRIASKMINFLISKKIPLEMSRVQDHMKEILSMVGMGMHHPVDSNSSELKVIKEDLMDQLQSLAKVNRRSFFKSVRAEVHKECVALSKQSLDALLPDDVSDRARETCVQISVTRTLDAIARWMIENITNDYFYTENRNEFDQLWERFVKGEMGSNPDIDEKKSGCLLSTSDNPNKPTLSEMIIEIKTSIKALHLENSDDQLCADEVRDCLARVSRGLLEPLEEVSAHMLSSLQMSTVDYSVYLLANAPRCMTPNVQDDFVQLWTGSMEPPKDLVTYISPCNMELLRKSRDPRNTWMKLEPFLMRLLKSGLVVPMVLETQCLQLLRVQWPVDFVKSFASCMKSVMESWSKTQYGATKDNSFGELADWMVWFWQDLGDSYLDEYPSL